MAPPAGREADGPFSALANVNASADALTSNTTTTTTTTTTTANTTAKVPALPPAIAVAPSSTTTSHATKRRRTAPVLADCCRTCRLRKVKCSGNPGDGPCTNCFRLDLSCTFTVAEDDDEPAIARTTPSHSHTEAGTLRKRAQRACGQCHSHKTKCSGDLPRCKRCEIGDLVCEYTPAKRRFTNVRLQEHARSGDVQACSSTVSSSTSQSIVSPPLSASSASAGAGVVDLSVDVCNLSAEDLLAWKNVMLRNFDAYINNMYWLPCQGFINPVETFRAIQDGTLDSAVAAAICSVASIFANPTEAGREFGQKCSSQVELHIFHNVYKFSDDLLILFALNITFNIIQGSFAKVWQCFGVASRLMLGLRINWDVLPRGRTFAEQESLRRIGWHFFHIDRLLAGGYEEYICCRAENMKISLPCDEAAFRENRPVLAERLHDRSAKTPTTVNLHAFQIRLIDLRHRIQVTTKKLCSASGPNLQYIDASKIMAEINGLQTELTRFHASLPQDVLLSDSSISRYMASPERPGYVFLHCHLAGSHVDLYRFSLPGQVEKVPVEILRKLPREFLARSQKQAVAHSMSFGRFCDAIQNEVDQMTDTGKLELAGDYSTLQLATTCVRVLLTALQNHLYRDITQETTAPLWRMGKVDESHIRFLIESIQRVTEPWRGILKIAQQAHDMNRTLVEEFDRTRKVAEQRYADRNFQLRANDDSRLPGPDSLLENLESRMLDDAKKPQYVGDSGSDRWLRSYQMVHDGPVTYAQPHAGGFTDEAGAPGIPLLLAQARTGLGDASELPTMYDAGNTMLALTDLTGMLPDGNALLPAAMTDMSMPQMNGSIDPAMYQQAPPPPPNAGYLMAQHGVFLDGYVDQYAAGAQGDSTHYGQQTSFA